MKKIKERSISKNVVSVSILQKIKQKRECID